MDARYVIGKDYEAIQTKVLHLVPTHAQVLSHNSLCLRRLSPNGGLHRSVAADSVALERNCDVLLATAEAEL